MTAGNINTGSNKITLGDGSAEGTLSYTDGTIIGTFERWILEASTSVDFLFPVGTSDYYRPAKQNYSTINILGAGTIFALTVKFVESNPGNSGLSLYDFDEWIYNTFVDGYWDFSTTTSFTSVNYDLELTGNGFDAFTITAATRLLTRADAGSDWIADGTHANAVGSTAKRTGISTTELPAQHCFGDNTSCEGPVTSDITGDNSVCTNETGVTYSLSSENNDSTYTWTITGGTIASGQGTDSITVDWGATGTANGNVRVVENNGCTNGDPVDFAVTVHTVPPSDITGKNSVAENTNGETYSVTDLGYTYNWTVTGGTIASGDGTASITVDWGAAGTGNVSVVAQDGTCGNAPAYDEDVYIYVIIESAQTGDWTTASTWDCNCVPQSTDNVRILNTHTVTLTTGGQGTTIDNFYINTGGTLDADGKELTVTGDISINGSYTSASAASLVLDGTSTTIDGTGTISLTGGAVEIATGNKSIQSTAVLNITNGDFEFTDAGISVTNNGSITIAENLVDVDATNTWTNASNSTVKIAGDFLTNATLNANGTNNTVHYNGTAAQNIKTPSSSYYNLEFTGASTKTQQAALTVLGNLTINSGTYNCNNFNLSVGGNWSNSGAFTEGTATVTFNGSDAQSITNAADEIFYAMTVDKSSDTLTFVNNVDVTNTLTMTQGNIDAATNNKILTLGDNSPTEGTLNHTSGTIIGEFQRWLTSTAVNRLFPVGTSTSYRPAIINFTNLTNGSLTVEFVASDPGSNGLPLSEDGLNINNQFTEGYWDFTAGTMSSIDYNLELTGTDFTSYTIDASTRIIKRTNGGAWGLDGSHSNASAPTCYRNNIDGISASGTQFGLGDTDCPSFTSNSITGPSDVCTNDQDDTYSIVPQDGANTFSWTITDGTLDDGTPNDENANVDWGAAASATAKVEVIESSGCYTAPAVDLDVTIHSLPTSSISGPNSVPENSTQGPYSVNQRTNYSYTWSIPVGNGSIASGQGTNSVTVDWGNSSNATLRCVGFYDPDDDDVADCSAAANEDYSVTVYDLKESNGTGGGDWDVAGTWNPSGVPAIDKNVKILTGDVINLTGNEQAASLTIEGTLNNKGNNLTLTGNYINDGTHDAGTGDILLNASATGFTIDGTGTTDNVNSFQINNFNYDVLSTADLTINGSVDIANDITVTNDGIITISKDMNGGNSGSTWINASNSTLNIGGGLLASGGGKGTLVANASGNTVIYNGGGAQSIKTPNPVIYYNLTCSGGGTKTMAASLQINGDLVISGTAALDVSNSDYNIDICGDWTNSSSNGDPFVERNGTVKFEGTTNQTITNSNDETFYNLTIWQGAGLKTLFGGTTNITITNNIDLTRGIIDAAGGSNLVAITDNATTNGGDGDSYVDGEVKKIGDEAFVFPLGDATTWARLGISAPSLTTTEYTAQYFNSAYSDLTVTGTLNNVSSTEYWTLNQAVNDDDISVTLYWEDATASGIDAYSTDLVVARYNGADWETKGQASISGTDPGNVISNLVSDYSPFTFGSLSSSKNPLPIELISFDASCDGNNAIISWTTASETNNDYFTLEKSLDAINFFEIAKIEGQGFSNSEVNYLFTDKNLFAGNNYYRLTQVDYDGNSKTFVPTALNCSKEENNNINVYPNPVRDYLTIYFSNIPESKVNISLFTPQGKSVYKTTRVPGTNRLKIDLEDLSPGIYIVRILNNKQQVVKKIMKF
ncbi:MAG: T9SS type A sorting domain-containing protein [Bacteroidota bacterium]|nr:T9SS type A sorting domain-containing protein [Bacteroidota bacterium]